MDKSDMVLILAGPVCAGLFGTLIKNLGKLGVLVNDCAGNMRSVLQKIESGKMLKQ